MRILFVTAHMGGGAGKAIAGMCNYAYKAGNEVTLLALEETKNRKYVEKLSEDITYIVAEEEQQIRDLHAEADVVVLNWWAHPLTFSYLLCIQDIPVRIVLWVHMNGCVYPAISSNFVLCFHQILFTCYYSYDNRSFQDTFDEIKGKSGVIYGIGEFEPRTMTPKKDYREKQAYVVGYLGTVDYNKMHKDFVQICEKIIEATENTLIVIYGECSETVQSDIENSKYKDKFVLKGFSDNVEESFREMDVLLYPLNPNTSGTTENVILEAMSCGVPIVALEQGTEKYIIQNEKTGILAKNAAELPGEAILLLLNEEKRRQIGRSAREYVLEEYSGCGNAERFLDVIAKVLLVEKTTIDFASVVGNNPYEWFVSVCGEYDETVREFIDGGELYSLVQCKDIIGNRTKSSVRHFYHYYKDAKLLKICKALWRDEYVKDS